MEILIYAMAAFEVVMLFLAFRLEDDGSTNTLGAVFQTMNILCLAAVFGHMFWLLSAGYTGQIVVHHGELELHIIAGLLLWFIGVSREKKPTIKKS